MWTKELFDDTILYKLNCDCGCKESSNMVILEKDKYGWSLRFEIEPVLRTRTAWHKYRPVEFLEMIWLRLTLASKILFKGEAKYVTDTVIGESNIDEFHDIIKDARKRIKAEKN